MSLFVYVELRDVGSRDEIRLLANSPTRVESFLRHLENFVVISVESSELIGSHLQAGNLLRGISEALADGSIRAAIRDPGVEATPLSLARWEESFKSAFPTRVLTGALEERVRQVESLLAPAFAAADSITVLDPALRPSNEQAREGIRWLLDRCNNFGISKVELWCDAMDKTKQHFEERLARELLALLHKSLPAMPKVIWTCLPHNGCFHDRFLSFNRGTPVRKRHVVTLGSGLAGVWFKDDRVTVVSRCDPEGFETAWKAVDKSKKSNGAWTVSYPPSR